jgi:UDP-N-acetylmuramoyl-L-alanyl-D-glutamate--2,6-diaminopimelate ligase
MIDAYFAILFCMKKSLSKSPVHKTPKDLQDALTSSPAIEAAWKDLTPLSVAKEGIEKLHLIRGRVERVQCGQPFTVIVDYAHTDDSLRKLYETFKNSRKIAVLGSTGGGRDSWKRPVLGAIADEYCSKIIITNEDPYDEDPMNIIKDVARGVTNHTPTIIINRREAIAHALREAKPLDVVLITGKGTDPYIMGPNGTKEAWDDARVVREELTKLGYEK